MGPSINNVQNQEVEGVKIPSEMYEILKIWVGTLGRAKFFLTMSFMDGPYLVMDKHNAMG